MEELRRICRLHYKLIPGLRRRGANNQADRMEYQRRLVLIKWLTQASNDDITALLALVLKL